MFAMNIRIAVVGWSLCVGTESIQQHVCISFTLKLRQMGPFQTTLVEHINTFKHSAIYNTSGVYNMLNNITEKVLKKRWLEPCLIV